jgi:excisionase family DNA binding protein
MPIDWITTSEAARLSGYHPDHIRRLIRARIIKGQKWGQQWQVSRNSLLAHLRSMEQLGERRGPKHENGEHL